jgi:hypothetical protein
VAILIEYSLGIADCLLFWHGLEHAVASISTNCLVFYQWQFMVCGVMVAHRVVIIFLLAMVAEVRFLARTRWFSDQVHDSINDMQMVN